MIKDIRSYQLTYCSICKLKDLNIEKGIICSLTNDTAKFEKICPDYLFEKTELERIKNNIKEVKKNYNTNKTVGFLTNSYYFVEKEKIKTSNFFKSKESTLNNLFIEKDSRFVISLLFGIFSIIFFVIFFIQKLNSSFIYLYILVILLSGAFYLIESKKEKKTISTSEDFLQFGKTKIYWREILDYGISKKSTRGGHLYILNIFTINNGIVNIIINNYDNLSQEKMIEILNFNKSELAD